jgi:AcrR family transcriptional regulator
MPAKTARARPLSVDDRRASIIDAVIPLLIEHGRGVTTRQIADAAGIAEGTVFRAFADKDALIDAAVAKFLDPAPINEALGAIEPQLTLEQKVNDILFILRSRMTGVLGIMNAVGMSGRPRTPSNRENFYELIGAALAPDLAQLHAPIDRIAQFVRLVAFSASIPRFNEGGEISTADLARLVTHGIAGLPAERASHAS